MLLAIGALAPLVVLLALRVHHLEDALAQSQIMVEIVSRPTERLLTTRHGTLFSSPYEWRDGQLLVPILMVVHVLTSPTASSFARIPVMEQKSSLRWASTLHVNTVDTVKEADLSFAARSSSSTWCHPALRCRALGPQVAKPLRARASIGVALRGSATST